MGSKIRHDVIDRVHESDDGQILLGTPPITAPEPPPSLRSDGMAETNDLP